jgi:cell division protein FtsA
MRGIDKLVSFMTGLDVRFGKPVVPIKEQLFLDRIINAESANLLGLLINGLYLSRSQKYPPGMIVSELQEEAKRKQPNKIQGAGLKSMVTDLFGKAREGLNGLLTEDDSSLN